MNTLNFDNISITNFRNSFNNLQMCLQDVSQWKLKSAAEHLVIGAISAVPLLGAGALWAGRQYFPQTSSNCIEQRRLKVANHISQVDYQMTQLYFLAHQLQGENEKLEPNATEALPRTPAIPASYLDYNLASIISFLKEHRESLSHAEQDLFTELLAPLESALTIAILIGAIGEAPTEETRSALERQLCGLLLQTYQELPVGSKMLIPAGYLTGSRYDLHRSAGHAVMLEITKQNDSKVDLRVFNTGEGLDYHVQTHSMIYPFALTNIDSRTLDIDFFKKLAELGKCTNDVNNKIDDFYYLLMWKFGFRNEYHVPSDGKYFSQGMANSCAQQSIMAWMKSSLVGKENVFYGFLNRFTADRLLKVKSVANSKARNFSIEQPYIAYSLTRQKSLRTTLYTATRRAFQGATVYTPLDGQVVEKITAYVSKTQTFFRHPADEGTSYIAKNSSLAGKEKGVLPPNYEDMRKLHNFGLMDEALNPGLRQQILALNTAELRLYAGLNEGIKRKITEGKITIQAALTIQRDIEAIAKDHPVFAQNIIYLETLLASGCLTPQQGLVICQQQSAEKLDRFLFNIPQLIIGDKLSVTESLALSNAEVERLRRNCINELILSGKMTVHDCLALSEPQFKRLDCPEVLLLTHSGVPWQEILELGERQFRIYIDYNIQDAIKIGKVSAKEALFASGADRLPPWDISNFIDLGVPYHEIPSLDARSIEILKNWAVKQLIRSGKPITECLSLSDVEIEQLKKID